MTSFFSSLLLASLVALTAGCPPASPEDAGTAPTSSDAGSTSSDAGSTSSDAGSTSSDAGSTSADAGSGSTDAGVSVVPCGDITLQGECQGDVLRYCQDEGLVELNCATEYFPDGVSASCGEIDANWGFDCKLATGESCIFEDELGSFTGFCEDGAGCIEDSSADITTCVAGAGACVEPAADADFAPICNGDTLFLECTAGQPYGLLCEGGCAEGTCLNVAEGQVCGATLTCADGLICTAEQICTVAPMPDAGVSDAGSAADAGSTTDAGSIADAGT